MYFSGVIDACKAGLIRQAEFAFSRGTIQYAYLKARESFPAETIRQKDIVAAWRLFNATYFLSQEPRSDVSPRAAFRHYLCDRREWKKNPHPLFDTAFYLESNGLGVEPRCNPLLHFVQTGGAQGFDPHPLFDSRWYAARHPDSIRGGSTPLAHYLASISSKKNPNPLFDGAWYLSKNPDVAKARFHPLIHYVLFGAKEGRDPHPLFDGCWYASRCAGPSALGTNPLAHYLREGRRDGLVPCAAFAADWYLEGNPDVAAAGINPFEHYVGSGWREHRDPHPLFAVDWYLGRNPDVAAAGIDPLGHYLSWGGLEGRDPSPYFDSDWYLRMNPDVARDGINPFLHFLEHGAGEGRDPNPYFDTTWYLEVNPDVRRAKINPLVHYALVGGFEGRNPSPRFDSAWYLAANPDVAAHHLNPLYHFLSSGESEGRKPQRRAASGEPDPISSMADRYRRSGEWTAAAVTDIHQVNPDIGAKFNPFRPLNLIARDDGRPPRLNVLFPSVQMRHATGGPNTAYLLAMYLARAGIPIRFVSTDVPPETELGPIKRHVHGLTGLDPDAFGVEFVDASDQTRPLTLGSRDVFLATAWWTAQMAKSATALFEKRRFVYLVQDYETIFYGGSERYTLAEGTYGFDHIPVVNTSLLFDHLKARGVGRYSSQELIDSALVFEPAIDRTQFFPEQKPANGPRTVLFYARPTVAARNLFGLGVAVLKSAVAAGMFGDGGWEFVGMGEQFEPVALGRNYSLRPAPWMTFETYAARMRQADILLSLMVSPHPSYPPLEIAACGGVAVTTTFGSKTEDRLRDIDANIFGAPPTVEDLVVALGRARQRSDEIRRTPHTDITLPTTWDKSLGPIVPALVRELGKLGLHTGTTATRPSAPVVRAPESAPPLLSIVTTVYDTDAAYLKALADSILATPKLDFAFEWLILDNGSRAAGTRRALAAIARDPRVRLDRVEPNAGIVGGQKWCLDHARGRYVLPVDSDDVLAAGAIDTYGKFLAAEGFPDIAYSDEDKLDANGPRDEYVKPDWDPVLFVHSCYIAHLTAFKREVAIALGCYTDPAAEGCHDWDTFTRFMLAGHVPAHLPKTLYTWRMHQASTAGNYQSKPYIYASHRAVLERFLAARHRLERYEVQLAPAFGGTPDYRFGTRAAVAEAARPIPTVRLGRVVSAAGLLKQIRALPAEAGRVHLLDERLEPQGDLWRDEAAVLMDLFSDTVMVGGRIHDGAIIVEAGHLFGHDGFATSPDVGRAIADPGYFAQTWKPHTVDAVPLGHCVVDRGFAEAALASCPEDTALDLVGFWFGAEARRDDRRVVYTPYLEAVRRDGATGIAERLDERSNALFARHAGTAFGDELLRPRRGLAPGREPRPIPAAAKPTYAAWAAARRRDDRAATGVSAPPAPISILTTVYERTDTALFRVAADSVRAQTKRPVEWLVLAHGPVPASLDTLLSELAREGLLTHLKLPVNLGIHGGLRHCLETATGDFCCWLDADDVLTPNAVEALAGAIAAHPDDRVFYSDEDLLIDGEFRHPYYRPDHDPVLGLAHSFVWHMICFSRIAALELGVFGSAERQYAQDWDLLVRFGAAGHRTVHVAEPIYHWRQHPRSLSNSGTHFDGSSKAVRAVLEQVRAGHPEPAVCEVAAYPFDLGAPDFYLRRLPIGRPSIAAIVLGASGGGRPPQCDGFPFTRTVTLAEAEATTGCATLLTALRDIDADHVLLLNNAVRSLDGHGLWQALKQFELVAEVAAVGGPILGAGREVVCGTPVYLDRRTLVDPMAGRVFGDGMDFSLGLKPHCVSAVSPDMVMLRRNFAIAALEAAAPLLDLARLGVWLGAAAVAEGVRLAYEPCFYGIVLSPDALFGPDLRRPSPVASGLRPRWGDEFPITGMAGFLRNRRWHE